jgi:hypothetical protein
VIPFQALARNVGTCRFDGKGETRRGGPPEGKSPDARHRGGAVRSSEEAVERPRSEGTASSSRAYGPTRKGRST